jgi:hypothetical protein
MAYEFKLTNEKDLGNLTFNYYKMLAMYFGKDSIATLNGLDAVDAMAELNNCIEYFVKNEIEMISLAKSDKHYKNCLSVLKRLSYSCENADYGYVFRVEL